MDAGWVGLGGALGAVARYGVLTVAPRLAPAGFPWGVLAANVAGSLLIGALAGWGSVRGGWGEGARLFLFVGVLGGFTTFSSITNDTLALAREGNALAALGNVALSLALGLGAAAMGYAGARAL
jgi:CrcB protein